jgi:uncharacterized protein YbaR (Trm112 family)
MPEAIRDIVLENRGTPEQIDFLICSHDNITFLVRNDIPRMMSEECDPVIGEKIFRTQQKRLFRCVSEDFSGGEISLEPRLLDFKSHDENAKLNGSFLPEREDASTERKACLFCQTSPLSSFDAAVP